MSTDPKSTHYDAGGIETIEFIRAKLSGVQMDAFAAYCLGNVIKYSSRLPYKGDPARDAEKLDQYGQWLAEELAMETERQEQVRDRYGFSADALVSEPERQRVDAQRPPDRHSTAHCPDGGACRHKCGLEPCKARP